jgi:hypothetical protein
MYERVQNLTNITNLYSIKTQSFELGFQYNFEKSKVNLLQIQSQTPRNSFDILTLKYKTHADILTSKRIKFQHVMHLMLYIKDNHMQ